MNKTTAKKMNARENAARKPGKAVLGAKPKLVIVIGAKPIKK